MINSRTTKYSSMFIAHCSIFTVLFLAVILICGCNITKDNNTSSGSSTSLIPTAPSGLIASAVSSTAITISWTDTASTELGFYVERRTPPSILWTVLPVTPTINAISYTDTGLTVNTTYYYRVKAFNFVGGSGYSNEAGTLTSWDSPTLTGAPASRTNHSALWTNYGMLVWGGWDGQNTLNTGGVYSTTANTWTAINTTGAPASRTGHSVIWTGSPAEGGTDKMIVWGGYTMASSQTDTVDNCESAWTGITGDITAITSTDSQSGYSAKIDIASPFTTGSIAYHGLTSPLNISARTSISLWVKATQNISSGVLSLFLDDADPTITPTLVEDMSINTTLNAGAWTLVTLSLANPALCTGIRYVGLKAASDPGIVTIYIDKIETSGGGTTYYNSGGIYNPNSNSWTAMSVTNAPDARAFHSAIWTGSVMIVWGGKSSSSYKNGGVYDPNTNEWKTGFQLDNLRTGAHTYTPAIRSKHLALWTGSGTESWRNKMIIWGGDGGGTSGSIYDISLDIWTTMSTTNAPSQRWGFSNIWTGEGSEAWRKALIIWGGYNGIEPLNDGAIYNPVSNSWTALATTNAPSARMYHTGAWSGAKMIIWGGDGLSQSGGAYDPVYNIWGTITTIDAPLARLYHTSVWSGTEMIIWGGSNGVNYFNSGGRYKVE
ncbi:MAG: fibronectin type III domain-containing protein [Planctomycetota bacterium]